MASSLIHSRWQGAVLVCGKCSKKIGGGFGRKGRTPLAKALRRELGLGKGRKARLGVVETKCLGVCPRGAVCLIDTRRPGEWRLVRAGEDVGALASGFEGSALTVMPVLSRHPPSFPPTDREDRATVDSGTSPA